VTAIIRKKLLNDSAIQKLRKFTQLRMSFKAQG